MFWACTLGVGQEMSFGIGKMALGYICLRRFLYSRGIVTQLVYGVFFQVIIEAIHSCIQLAAHRFRS
jgi:hypothetical protein